MSRVGKISRGIIAVALLLILCFSSAAGEEKEKIIRAGCPSCSTETVVSRKGRSGYELYIPGCWDIGRITMEIEGSGSFFQGGDYPFLSRTSCKHNKQNGT